jgi:hypothetical protein
MHELASLVRSMNAGPFDLTIDLVFPDQATYEHVVAAAVVTPEVIGRLYAVPAEEVRVIPFAPGLAIKVSFPRTISAGDLGDDDMLGCQQHAPLVVLQVPDRPSA